MVPSQSGPGGSARRAGRDPFPEDRVEPAFGLAARELREAGLRRAPVARAVALERRMLQADEIAPSSAATPSGS
jgi:hypothetical protein